MSKQKKEQQKKKKREQALKERLVKYQARNAAKGKDDGFLDHVNQLIRRKNYTEAQEILLDYVAKYPKVAKPFEVLAKVCASMEDFPNMFWAAEQLLQVGERTFEDYSIYQFACLRNAMPVNLMECEEQMQRRFHYKSDADLTSLREDMLGSFKSDAALVGDDLTPYTDEQLLDLMRRHEKSLLFLSAQRFDPAVWHCNQLIAKFPFFRSAYNNKALAVMLDQGPEEAEPLFQQAYKHHPDNLFVNAFKIRQLALLGRHEELSVLSDRLASVPLIFPNKHDFFTGKIEAFAWADDLERIIETYQYALEEMGEEWNMQQPACAMSTHYVAVAHARLGNHETAIELWKSIPPNKSEIASENLEDIQKQIGEQNGSWFFEYGHWLPHRFFNMLHQASLRLRIDDERDDDEKTRVYEQHLVPFFKKAFTLWPSLERTLVEMLKRGGPDSRQWVRMFLGHCPTPELKAAVLDFVMGESGSDACRNGYIGTISPLGWLESGAFRFWRNGESHEIQVSGIEIYWEAKKLNPPLSPKGSQKFSDAQDIANSGNWERAIQLLEEINAKEPGRPSVLYNMATYHLALCQEYVHDEIIDRLALTSPDYFFVKTALAKRFILQDRLDEAWDILKSLHAMKRMHGSEYQAMMGTTVLYHLARDEVDTAKSIYQSCVGLVGDDAFPPFERFQSELER